MSDKQQTGNSTLSALHALVTKVEKTFDAKEILLAAFLDVEGAFDNASFTSMKTAMTKRGFSRNITDWIEEMLSIREISAYLEDSVVKVTTVLKAEYYLPSSGLWLLMIFL